MPLPKVSKYTINSFERIIKEEDSKNNLESFIEEKMDKMHEENKELNDFVVSKAKYFGSPSAVFVAVYWLLKSQLEVDELDKEYAKT